jgi:hypothetical protein
VKRLLLLGLVLLGLLSFWSVFSKGVPESNEFGYQSMIWEEPEYNRWVVQIHVLDWGEYSTPEDALKAGVEESFIYPEHPLQCMVTLHYQVDEYNWLIVFVGDDCREHLYWWEYR